MRPNYRRASRKNDIPCGECKFHSLPGWLNKIECSLDHYRTVGWKMTCDRAEAKEES